MNSLEMSQKYHERVIKSARTFFARWQGANGLMFEMTNSHRTLRILVQREDHRENLLVSCIEPVRISGLVQWSNCQLEVGTAPIPSSDELGFRVWDVGAKLEIVCGGLEVKENVKI